MLRIAKFLTALFLLLDFTAEGAIAKNTLLRGRVQETVSGKPVPFTSIYFQELAFGVATDESGSFSLETAYKGMAHVTISCIGYQTLDTLVLLEEKAQLLFSISSLSYSLDEVVVSAREAVKENSVSLIGKTAMKHIQPSSVSDLLQLLPGGQTSEVNMSTANFISLRQAGTDINTSLGTAFIVDGSPMGNDGNLQNFYSLGSSAATARLTTSQGIDMRTIPTDRIESMEVIRGIPSARYGDLTAGVVKIELKNGETPWEARSKVDLKNKLFSINKGFVLPRNGGRLNVDTDYTLYRPDPRSELTSYKRITLSGRYENNIRLKDDVSLVYKFNAGFTGSFDDIKKDPDALSKDDYLKNSYQSIELTASGVMRFENHWIRSINYNAGIDYTADKLDMVKRMSLGGTIPLTTLATEAGIYNTGYLPAEYNSALIVDGNPVDVSLSLEAKSEWKPGSMFHALDYGINYRYTKNYGDGELYDALMPPFSATKSSRPRAFSDVPALNKLSVYAEDLITWEMADNWTLRLQPGVRATTLPGMHGNYRMSGKFYFEPRLNTRLTLPHFILGDKKITLAFTLGAGQMYKFPTIAQLYPDRLYFDYVQLNYYASNPEYRYANIRTYVEDPTNYSIEPAKNLKLEAGIVLTAGNLKLDVTFFHEKMNNGFSTGSEIVNHNYTYYEAGSVQNPSKKPDLSEFISTQETITTLYSRTMNDAGVHKTGIEYTVNFGKIAPLYTTVWINGAWFDTHYFQTSNQFYSKPNHVINNRPYPFVGVYDYNGSNANRKSQFNTNLNFDTHIPLLQMIFTTSIQSMWFESRQTDLNSGLPAAFLDAQGNRYNFEPSMTTDPVLRHLVDTYNQYTFLKSETAMATKVNLKLSKEIGKNLLIACYFNNILSYLPEYTSVYGTKVNRTVTPHFGAELNFKF